MKFPISSLSRLMLGTAQLGMDYGISNKGGKPKEIDATSIIRATWKAGINCFDTAQIYGSSEAVLGTAFSNEGISSEALVITKLAPSLGPDDDIRTAVNQSLEALGQAKLFGILQHRQESLAIWDDSWRPVLVSLRDKGLVDYLGVSVYDNEYIDKALISKDVDLIQLPFNIFDRRAEKLDVFSRAVEYDKTIFVRGIFLQGLLLKDPNDLSAAMAYASGPLTEFRVRCDEVGLTPLEACLGYVLAIAKGAIIIFGAESPDQVREMAALIHRLDVETFPIEAFEGIGQPEDSRVIDPRKWF